MYDTEFLFQLRQSVLLSFTHILRTFSYVDRRYFNKTLLYRSLFYRSS